MVACAMRLSGAVAQPQLARHADVRAAGKPVLSLRRSTFRANVAARASQTEQPALQAVGLKVEQAVAVTTAVSTFLMAGNASAAQEIAALAADNRLGTISLLFLPVLGWVGFNIVGPAFRQLDAMSGAPTPKKGTAKRRSVAAIIGAGLLAASMLSVGSADAATEVAQLADSDGRLGAILTLFVPALGWVLFNILGPAQRQLDAMSDATEAPRATKTLRKRGLVAGLGMSAAGASLMLADSASAASEFAQVADSDGRLGAILTLFVPAVGWVLFNILGPAQRQLDAMSGDAPVTKKSTKRRGVAAAVGMGAAAMSMMAVESANAASEFAQVADSDSRLGAILTLFVPAIGWVLFNILGPAQRQLDAMSSADVPRKATVKRRSVAAGLGLSAAAASLMLVDSASAASEFAQVADSDGRLGAILTLFVPAIGWVLFNILGPAQRQLDAMSSDAPATKKPTKRRGVAAAVGMGAAAMSMLAVESASAATEFAQVADSDGRLGAILTLFVPAIGWVLFNILGPAQRQLDAMSSTDAPRKATVRRK